ncbi:MAG: hypothetical protein RLY20_1379 [Verrucomicrobiota bacterium]|jgi:hypothetical protein
MSEKRSGCKSCLIWFACVFGFFMLIVGITVYLGYRKVVSVRDQFTSAKPQSMPALNYTPAEYTAVTNRLQQFASIAEAGRSNIQFSLTARDLNTLVYGAGLSNRAYLSFTSNAIAGQFCIPLDFIQAPVLRGLLRDRFLNGVGVLGVNCEDGDLKVNLQQLSVNGVSLPEDYMANFRQYNLAEGVATNESVHASMARVKRIAVENDRLIFEIGATNSTR